MKFNDFLETQLNGEQKKAVIHTHGPLLIVAGAGSGKTRIITSRITNLLLNHHIDSTAVIALTFTNKAAQEMKERIHLFLGHTNTPLPFVGTFHSYCLSLLKKNQHLLDIPFLSIMDEEDRSKLLASIIKKNNLQKQFSAKSIGYHISQKKNHLFSNSGNDVFLENQLLAEIYQTYEKEKELSKCLDFDDLLLQALKLFKKFPFKNRFQATVRHVLVDEYQDTNAIQHALLKEMCLQEKDIAIDSICAVGDEDQSIYSWRGATVANILHFQYDFPQTTVITIEQNYRSVQPILHVANQIITHNTDRNPKKLWSEKTASNRVRIISCLSEYQEALAIALCTKTFKQKKLHSSVAVLYRTHFQSRSIEEVLIKRNIPYKIIGGINFYERKEIKDIIAYLRLIVNPFDRTSLMRIINVPTRGLGQAVEESIDIAWQQQPFLTFQELLTELIRKKEITGKKEGSINQFLSCFQNLHADSFPHTTIEKIVSHTQYFNYLKESFDEQDAIQRIDNVKELLHIDLHGISTISNFLDHIALMQEHTKNYEEVSHPVLLMTLHAAKGLEFDTVIITGLEEGLLPSARSLADTLAIQEERRLFYVGITRAKEHLLLTRAHHRYTYGSMNSQPLSRFLNEMPPDVVHEENITEYNEIQLDHFFSSWFGIPSSRLPVYTFGARTTKIASPPITATAFDTPKKSIYSNAHWKNNQMVKHATFGIGMIKNIEQKAMITYLTINFKSGQKKLSSQFVQKV
jgi:DNA helicase-2/ATP-dependent DNA helicase PcrA